LAALIDGEGSILLGPIKRSKRPKIEYPRPEIYISSTDKELLDWVKSVFGGTISKKKTYKEHHKNSYGWRIANKKAAELMKLVIPYMKIEKKINRAKLLITLSDELTVRNGRYTQQQIADRVKLYKDFYNVT